MTETDLYSEYKGVYVPKYHSPPESLQYMEGLTFRQDDIVIATYPRSGKLYRLSMSFALIRSVKSSSITAYSQYSTGPVAGGPLTGYQSITGNTHTPRGQKSEISSAIVRVLGG